MSKNMGEQTENSEALRNEIVESQIIEADFLKWKLIAIGVVSSISLGFTPSDGNNSNPPGVEWLLCAIPLICAYIDFVSINIKLRILTIGAYLKNNGSKYEQFVSQTRVKKANPFILETAALHGSSIVFNLVLAGIGFTNIAVQLVRNVYVICGVLGLVAAIFTWNFYTKRAKQIQKLAQSKNN